MLPYKKTFTIAPLHDGETDITTMLSDLTKHHKIPSCIGPTLTDVIIG